jgi:hypothetical protein
MVEVRVRNAVLAVPSLVSDGRDGIKGLPLLSYMTLLLIAAREGELPSFMSHYYQCVIKRVKVAVLAVWYSFLKGLR